MEYNPRVFNGEHAEDIFAEVVHSNRMAEKVRVLENVKNEIVVTSITGELEYVPYKEKIREADIDAANNNLKFGDSKVAPKKMMAFTVFTMDELRNSRFSKDMAGGAANTGSNEFEQTVINHTLPRLGLGFERTGWNHISAATKAAIAVSDATAAQKAWAAAQPAKLVDGLLAQMIAAGTIKNQDFGKVIPIVGDSAGSLKGEYKKIYEKIPSEVLEKGDAVIYSPFVDRQKINMANMDEQFRDVFTVANGSYSFLGVKIEFIPIPNNMKAVGRGGSMGDFIFATDLLSDISSFEINKVNNAGDEIFMKQVAVLDTAIVVPTQKILYIAA
ncbi:hypothetical protein [Rufibacter quisquiliarum]|uniref:Phage capsid protein n=1 Tax=Rufibacter quisquiliarum TaxID=1549639 RepID=A0A839GEV5_9BACT|nr:hypothetical protein [Rufibacter quisquiliarum]MBA9076073.1 hypothetical protein [Rufibacter quisquiliarum]